MKRARVNEGDAVKVLVGQRIVNDKLTERWMRGRVVAVQGTRRGREVFVRPFSAGTKGRWFPIRVIKVMDAVEALSHAAGRRKR